MECVRSTCIPSHIRLALIWLTLLLTAFWVGIIIAVQNVNGFGPFEVDQTVPHEGRYVFAGLLQLLTLFWTISFALDILNYSRINVFELCSVDKDTALVVPPIEVAKLSAMSSAIFLVGVCLHVHLYCMFTPYVCV